MISGNTTLNCRGRLLDLSRPVVMGILNITPDSFYAGSRIQSENNLLVRAETMLRNGASILDVGAESTRPGSEPVSEEEERQRLLPAVALLHREFPAAVISADTRKSRIAADAILAGASLINDVSAGRFDEKILEVVQETQVPYVLMHMKGNPANMQQQPHYENVVEEVFDFFKVNILRLRARGIGDILLDPGFGFGKTPEHNFTLLKHLKTFHVFGFPLLAGLSRKSMVCKTLQISPEQALNGTTVLNTIALMQGVRVLRVHDVQEAREAIQLVQALHGTSIADF